MDASASGSGPTDARVPAVAEILAACRRDDRLRRRAVLSLLRTLNTDRAGGVR